MKLDGSHVNALRLDTDELEAYAARILLELATRKKQPDIFRVANTITMKAYGYREEAERSVPDRSELD